MQLLRALEQAEHDLAAAAVALGIHQLIEGLLPLAGLLRIAVEGALGVRILVVHGHGEPFVKLAGHAKETGSDTGSLVSCAQRAPDSAYPSSTTRVRIGLPID